MTLSKLLPAQEAAKFIQMVAMIRFIVMLITYMQNWAKEMIIMKARLKKLQMRFGVKQAMIH